MTIIIQKFVNYKQIINHTKKQIKSFFQQNITYIISPIKQKKSLKQNNSIMKQSHKQSKVIKQQQMFQGKWLGLKYTTYSIGDKIIPNYQTVYRTTTKKSGRTLDGVQVIPIIKYNQPNKCSQVVLIANYRPPVNKFVIQFPSGLLEDQNYQQNARRQVKQQTGYIIDKFIQIPHPVMHCDPWKSNQSGLFYIGIINGNDPNHHKQQELQNQQNIKVHILPLNQNLLTTVHKLAEDNKYVLQGKVWSVCLGLAMNGLIK